MKFAKLYVNGWRQFAEIDIDFHDRLTIIAGANGAGKSTLLRLLSQHFGFHYNLIATPSISKSGTLSYFSGIFRKRSSEPFYGMENVGAITYSNSAQTLLQIPSQGGGVTYNVHLSSMQSVQGLFINSHRPTSNYQAIASIPTNAISVEQAYQAYSQEIINKYNNSYSQFSHIYRIKEAIVSMATFGPGNRNVQRNEVLDKTYEDFKVMLSKVLPETIGFRDISIRIPDIVIINSSGEFVLDAASGDLMALIDFAWQMFLYSQGKDEFVAVMIRPH